MITDPDPQGVSRIEEIMHAMMILQRCIRTLSVLVKSGQLNYIIWNLEEIYKEPLACVLAIGPGVGWAG